MTGPDESRIASTPADIREGSIAEHFLEASEFQKPDALKYKASGDWHPISHAELYDKVKKLALGLEALGIARGDRVAILSENRPEWLMADFACVMARAVSLPLYPVLPADQIDYMLQDSEARAIFVSSEEQLQKIRQLKSGMPALEYAIVFEDIAAGEPWVHALAELTEMGAGPATSMSDDEYR